MKKQSDKAQGSKDAVSGKEVKSRKGIGGPKPKPEEEKTKYAVGSFYLTKAEKEAYDRVFKQSGIKNQTQFFRKHFFGGGLKLHYFDKNTELIYDKLGDIQSEINQIGVSINQIATSVNSGASERILLTSLNEAKIMLRAIEVEQQRILALMETLIEHSDDVREEEKRMEEKKLSAIENLSKR